MKLSTFILSAGLVAAQSPTATIVGRVTDRSGAVIGGALIEVRNSGTNDRRTARSEADGQYTIPVLPAGIYEIGITHPGFASAVQRDLELQLDQQARVDFNLTLGDLAQTVEVRAPAPVLNTESSAKGEVITAREMVEMPLEGRDFGDLVYLVPGVHDRQEGGSGAGYAINGARADNSGFMVDGINNNDARTTAAQVRPSLESIQEFKLLTANYSAELGRFSGGVVSIALKSGTNQVHGALFEFVRNNKSDARNFFDANVPELRRNQFGGALDGPVFIPRLYDGHNRTFFLFSWESFRQVSGTTQLSRVPTLLQRQGDFSDVRDGLGKPVAVRDPFAANAPFPNNLVPLNRWDPVGAKVMQVYPGPNISGVNNYRGALRSDSPRDTFTWKADHQLRPNHTLSGRYIWSENDTLYPGSELGIFRIPTKLLGQLGGLSLTSVLRPNLVFEARAGVSRTAYHEFQGHYGEDVAAELGLTGGTHDPQLLGFPRFIVTNIAQLGDGATAPSIYAITNYQSGGSITWVRSGHTVKAGAEFVRSQFFQNNVTNARGQMNFTGQWTNDAVADLQLGLITSSTRQTQGAFSYLLQNYYGVYIQDDYKASSRLTLNIGLRWDPLSPFHEKYGRWASYVPAIGKIIVADDRGLPALNADVAAAGLNNYVGLARDYGLPSALVNGNMNNFAPRIGFAWRPFGGNRTVLRSGYGIFYGGSLQQFVIVQLGASFPLAKTQTFSRVNNQPSLLTLQNPYPDSLARFTGTTTSVGYEVNPKSSYMQNWNFTLEREFGGGTALEIGYIGSKGTHLGKVYDINQPYYSPALRNADGSLPRPLPYFGQINYFSFDSNSAFQSGSATLRRRMANGFFFRANYTMGKSIDSASQTMGSGAGDYAGAQDSRNLRLDRGLSTFDTRHSVTGNFTYTLPRRLPLPLRDWEFAGTFRAYSGHPYTPLVSNVNLAAGESSRPDRIGWGMLDHPTPDHWFDIAAFPPVPTGAFRIGNSGRNVLTGPSHSNVNLSLMRNFRIQERAKLQMRWEVYNISNHANFSLPVATVNSPNAGSVTSASGARVMQLGARLSF